MAGGRNSSLIREKYLAIVTAQAKYSSSSSSSHPLGKNEDHNNNNINNNNNNNKAGEEVKEESKDLEQPLELLGIQQRHEQYRLRSKPIILRGGRSWYIEMDACPGHSDAQHRMVIVPGVARPLEDDDDDDEEHDVIAPKINGKALLRASVAKVTMLNALNPQRFRTSSSLLSKTKKTRVSIAALIEEDDDPDPDLDIPLFSILLDTPDPIVETEEHEMTVASQPTTIRTNKRGSLFGSTPQSTPPSTTSTTASAERHTEQPNHHHHDNNNDNNSNDSAHHDGNDGNDRNDDTDDDDDDELLEGFGKRSKPKPSVRRFVKQNKFLKKVFTRRGKDTADPILIDDDYFDT